MLNNLIISPDIENKIIKKHGIRRVDVESCFCNCSGEWLEDTRVAHKTNPPTMWFIAYSHKRDLLKVVFVEDNGKLYLKTAYRPNATETSIYNRYTKGIS